MCERLDIYVPIDAHANFDSVYFLDIRKTFVERLNIDKL